MCNRNRAGRGNGPRRALVAAAFVLAASAYGAPALADELIVDNADATVQVSGAWQTSATTPGFYGGGYLFHMPGRGSG